MLQLEARAEKFTEFRYAFLGRKKQKALIYVISRQRETSNLGLFEKQAAPAILLAAMFGVWP